MKKNLRLLMMFVLTLMGTTASWADEGTLYTWDFTSSSSSCTLVGGGQGGSYSYPSDVDANVKLEVDATQGKFNPRGGDVQVNATTVIKVPVKSAGDVITIYNYHDGSNGVGYTIGSVTKTKSDISYEYTVTKTEATAGYATITVTANGYMEKFMVRQYEASDEDPSANYENVAATYAWTVGNEGAATITGTNIAAATSLTKWKAGTGLTVTTAAYSDQGAGTIVEYNPNSSKMGEVDGALVEYTIKMKKGTTFTLTSISYDAVKNGTDNATYKWGYTIDGTASATTEVNKDNIVRNNNKTGSPATTHTETITGANAGQKVTVRFYISGVDAGKKMAIGNVKINGVVNGTVEKRSFTDFKVDFRVQKSDEQKYTVILPENGELPTGIDISNVSINGAQHGASSATITVPVDGPVKFTIGSCQFGNHTVTVKNGDNETIATIDNNNGCENTVSDIASATYNKYVTYTYNVEKSNTLTFTLNGYLPFFFAEACDFIESVDVTYYDVDGKTVIGTKTVDGGSELTYAYGADDVTVTEGSKFRGWFNGTASTSAKVPEGTAVDADLALYARVTEIEKPEVGKIFKYDLTKTYFYIEDHEAITVDGGKYHNNHGFIFQNGNSFSVDVAGKAQIMLGLCQHSADAAITVTNTAGSSVGTIASAKGASDGAITPFQYDGEATKLTFTFGGTTYLHSVKVYNVSELVKKDETTGYYIVPANDGASLTLALESANSESSESSPAKVFIPNGTYVVDGSEINGTNNVPAIAITNNNLSIIGESMDGVIIKTTITAEQESLKSALLGITGENTYIQDVTLQNNAAFNASTKAERANAIRDAGNYSILNNVYLKGTQDTYLTYRNKDNVAQKIYYNGGKIEGTVDFICGAGDVFFNEVNLFCANSATAKKTTEDYICAPATYDYENFGYVFNKCNISGEESQKGTYWLARTWQNDPKATYIDVNYGDFAPTASLFKTMNTSTTTDKCHSYKSTDAEAANYSVEKVLGDAFAAKAQAAVVQADAPKATMANGVITITPADGGDAGTYLIEEKNGGFVAITNELTYTLPAAAAAARAPEESTVAYTVRAANARGGFGKAADVTDATGINKVNVEKNAADQVVYDLQGRRVENATRGIYIVNGKKVVIK